MFVLCVRFMISASSLIQSTQLLPIYLYGCKAARQRRHMQQGAAAMLFGHIFTFAVVARINKFEAPN